MQGFVDLVYPKVCILCRKSLKNTASINDIVCLDCWTKAKKNTPPFCTSCGRHLEKKNFAKNICPGCARKKLHFDRAFSPYLYDGVIKEMIHQFKYQGKEHLSKTLAQPMCNFIKEYSLPLEYLDCIIPVPLDNTKLREREFNQAQVLSKHIGEEFNIEVLPDCLRRTRSTRSQTELDIKDRLKNVEGCFSLKEGYSLKGKNILLVDDVLTTGSTASEATRAIKESACGFVFVLTLAN